MKKIIIIIIISAFCLFSCEQKVKLNEENHLQLFNLKGKVKQINYDYLLNEITDISYKPVGKANPKFYDLGCIGDIDLSYTRIFSDLDFYYNHIFFESYNIVLEQLINKRFYENRCDSYEIKFNSNGNVTDFKGLKNDTLISNINFYYDNENVIKIKHFYNKKEEKLYGKEKKILEEVTEFEYGENNLISNKKFNNNNGLTSTSEYFYTLDKDKKEIIINEKEHIKFTNNKIKNNEYKYKITLDKNSKIESINYEMENKIINFSDGKIKKITEFDKQNKLTFNIEINYIDNNFSVVKKTYYGRLNEMYFEYEENGNLKNVKCNDESKKEFLNNLKFNYEYDNLKNWTKQSYSRDRSGYDNYLVYMEKRKKYSDDFYLLHGYSPFTFREDVDVEIEKIYKKKYSSKIDVNRRIIYY